MNAIASGTTRLTSFCAVAVFCRAPLPGHAKTRLISMLGAEGAAKLHAEMALQTARTTLAAGIGPVTLWCAPDSRHAFFQTLAREHPINLADQRGQDLGARMLDAAVRTLASVRQMLIIGSDCPGLTAAYLQSAKDRLQERDAVIGPAEDGGYVLLGLKQARPELFTAMPWGGPQVLAITRARLADLDWQWQELPVLWDVDTPADFARWQRERMAPAETETFTMQASSTSVRS